MTANPVAQTATVTFDASRTTVEDLDGRGPGPPPSGRPTGQPMTDHDATPPGGTGSGSDPMGSPEKVRGHGGHTETSMAGMVRDVRDRFFATYSERMFESRTVGALTEADAFEALAGPAEQLGVLSVTRARGVSGGSAPAR